MSRGRKATLGQGIALWLFCYSGSLTVITGMMAVEAEASPLKKVALALAFLWLLQVNARAFRRTATTHGKEEEP